MQNLGSGEAGKCHVLNGKESSVFSCLTRVGETPGFEEGCADFPGRVGVFLADVVDFLDAAGGWERMGGRWWVKELFESK